MKNGKTTKPKTETKRNQIAIPTNQDGIYVIVAVTESIGIGFGSSGLTDNGKMFSIYWSLSKIQDAKKPLVYPNAHAQGEKVLTKVVLADGKQVDRWLPWHRGFKSPVQLDWRKIEDANNNLPMVADAMRQFLVQKGMV